MIPAPSLRESSATFVTTCPEVVGCTAQAVAAAGVMRLANSYPEEERFGEDLFNNAETVAGAILRWLGIPHDARAVLASTESSHDDLVEALKVSTVFLRLEARDHRERGAHGKADACDGQAARNEALIAALSKVEGE